MAEESVDTAIAVLKAKVEMLSFVCKNELVNRHEFTPVKLIAYGIATVALTSVVVAIVSYVVKRSI